MNASNPLTREEIEKQLTETYVNQLVTHIFPKSTTSGKIHKISYWPDNGEDLVHFQLGNKMYKCELDYFKENTRIL